VNRSITLTRSSQSGNHEAQLGFECQSQAVRVAIRTALAIAEGTSLPVSAAADDLRAAYCCLLASLINWATLESGPTGSTKRTWLPFDSASGSFLRCFF